MVYCIRSEEARSVCDVFQSSKRSYSLLSLHASDLLINADSSPMVAEIPKICNRVSVGPSPN